MKTILGNVDAASRASAALRSLGFMSAEVAETTVVTGGEVTSGRRSKIKHGGQINRCDDYKRASYIFIFLTQ